MDTFSIDEEGRRRFEAAWAKGAPLPIDQCLPDSGEPRWLSTLEELVAIELEFGWKARPVDGPRLEAYFERYPALRQSEIARRLIQQEFDVRRMLGHRPTPISYRQRFPEWTKDWDLEPHDTSSNDAQAELTPGEFGTTVAAGAQDGSGSDGEPLLMATLDTTPESRGRYSLSRVHAEGGLGRVWIAHDPVLNREVALKELKPSPSRNPEAWQRFLKEAQVTGQLEHPNIVPVYEFVRAADGTKPFYTMRFIRGHTLRHFVTEYHRRRSEGPEEPLERRRLLQSFVSVCNAISFAHSRGVVHRDLKPANVVLGDFGEVLVLDWGLARTSDMPQHAAEGIQVTESVAGDLTLRGHILGTPAYMSPEQAEGNVDLIDHRTDVYGLGAILFEILTGRAPHVGGNSVSILQRIILGPTPRASEVGPSVPAALDAVCSRAMEKLPADRYSSAAEVVRDVERHLADEPVSVYHEPPSVRVGRFVRRHRTPVAASSAALILLTIGTIISLFVWHAAIAHRHEDLLELQAVVDSDESLGLKELQRGQFQTAAQLLDGANRRAAGEPALPLDLRQRVADEADEIGRINDFYRLADLAERNEFLEYDFLADDQCHAALERINVFNAPHWPEQLPGRENLTATQRELLREDVFREVLLLAGLRAKRGLMKSLKNTGDPEASTEYRKALAMLELSRQLRPTRSAQVLEVFCRMGLGELGKLKPQPPIEPISSADQYFIGMLYLWVGSANSDPVGLGLKMVQPMTGLDFTDPMAKSDRLLRMAIAGEPWQYWNYFMLGWSKLGRNDFAGAELAFDACVALNPANGLGYTYRGWTHVRQASQAKLPADRDEFRRRGLADLARARTVEPTNPELAWQEAHALTTIDQIENALTVYQRAVELEPPLETWNGHRVQVDKRAYLNGMIAFATQATVRLPRNPDAWSALASAARMLGQNEQAGKAAARALELRAKDPTALAIRGELAREQHQPDSALADFTAALAAKPAHWLAAQGRAAIHASQSLPAKALEDCDYLASIAETDWQRVAAQLGRASALRQLNRPTDADAALAAARAIDPQAIDPRAAESPGNKGTE